MLLLVGWSELGLLSRAIEMRISSRLRARVGSAEPVMVRAPGSSVRSWRRLAVMRLVFVVLGFESMECASGRKGRPPRTSYSLRRSEM